MDEMSAVPKEGMKIERPLTDGLKAGHGILLFLAFCLTAFTLWILVLEWAGEPLPRFLRFVIPV